LVTDRHNILAGWRNHFAQLLDVHGVSNVRPTEIRKVGPQLPESSAIEVKMCIEKLKRHKSPGIDQIRTELNKAAGRTIRSDIHKLIISVWNKEEMPEEWKQSIIVPIYKKGDKTDCSNYTGISLFPTAYKLLPNILLSVLTLYAGEIIGDHQCGFRRNRSTTDNIFCISQILEKNWE
jgi:hypothetical protein